MMPGQKWHFNWATRDDRKKGVLSAESPWHLQRRTDAWGGTEENQFRFLGEIIAAVRTGP